MTDLTVSQSDTDQPVKRVLLVAPQPFFTAAGTPINVLQMCRALTDIGYRVHLATLPSGQDIALDNLVYHRVRRVPLIKQVPVGFSIGKAVYDILLAIELVRLLMRHPFTAVHAIEEAAFYAVPIAGLFGVPAVSDLDSDLCLQLKQNRSPIARWLASPAAPLRRWALRRSVGVITVARHLTDMATEISPGIPVFEIRDIPLEAALRHPESEQVERLRQEFGLGRERIAVYTGNFDQRQGVDVLVDAMPAVLKRFPDATLLLVGGEPDRIEAMRARAKQLGVGAAIRFAGKQPPETMPEFMALANVLVSPRLEPLVTPLKIYTYMVSGRPIVATDLPTHTQVLDERSAILAAPTADGLAAGISQAFEDPAAAEPLARQARRRVEQNHTYETFRRQLGEVYTTVEREAGRRKARA